MYCTIVNLEHLPELKSFKRDGFSHVQLLIRRKCVCILSNWFSIITASNMKFYQCSNFPLFINLLSFNACIISFTFSKILCFSTHLTFCIWNHGLTTIINNTIFLWLFADTMAHLKGIFISIYDTKVSISHRSRIQLSFNNQITLRIEMTVKFQAEILSDDSIDFIDAN